MNQSHPIIVILGPTASGKSSLAVAIAQKIKGEIVSADSRQVYKGMDLGTGKIKHSEMKGIPHHLLDIVSPNYIFTAVEYAKYGERAFLKIWKRGKIPIVCGGTGFYIRALIDRMEIPQVAPNLALRKKLEKKSVEKLFSVLKKKDPERALEIDPKNPRRLVRALEIIESLGKVPRFKIHPRKNVLILGIKKSPKTLKKLIKTRLEMRLRSGMLREIKNLHKKGITWKKLESFGLEYKYGALLLQGKLDKKEFKEKLNDQIVRYAKRQMTWFKRDSRIHWVKNQKEALRLTENFLSNKKALVGL